MNILDLAPEKVDVDKTKIRYFGPEAFEGMRAAGRLVAEALDMLVEYAKPGVTTERLDRLMFEFALDHKAYPATLNYRGYRHSICTSINHVVCHGAPGPKPLRDGDIVNIDGTLILNGWHGDSSRMYPIGTINRKAERLLQVTYEALMRGVAAVKPGGTTYDIGLAIQSYVESERFSVVRDFCGHGLGDVFHCPPNILHYGRDEKGKRVPGIDLKPGMIFTIEPMVNAGKADTKVLGDGWTAVTRDKSLSAQFEHTVGVTATGVEVFTYSPKGWHCPPYLPVA
jgi:methionyl aminopeptidase